MPPRIRVSGSLQGSGSSLYRRPVLPFLYPSIVGPAQRCTSIRSASILTSLSDNRSSYQKRIRLGRGPSSGKGKTSGRGHKGQKQHGKVPRGFEGGQTPLHIVKGIRGFKNVLSVDMQTVPLSRILSWIAQGRIDPTKPITVRELAMSRCVTDIKDGVKLLASSQRHDASIDEVPTLAQPLNIVVSRASASAIAAVEAAGGNVLTRYYTRWAIQRIIRGTMDPIESLRYPTYAHGEVPSKPALKTAEPKTDNPTEQVTYRAEAPATPPAPWAKPALPTSGRYTQRLPDATGRKDIEYYRDAAHRGYLSGQVQEGQSPSLYFRPPRVGTAPKRKAGRAGSAGQRKLGGEDNAIW